MKKCCKCGTENPNDQQAHCPKCGVDYAKFEKYLAEKKARENLGQRFEKEIEVGEALTIPYCDEENDKDQHSYYWIDLLIWIIVLLAFVVGAIELWFCLSIWDTLASWVPTSANEKVRVGMFIVFVEALSVSCILSLAGLLHLCRDIANNTRASRFYLRGLTHQK